MGPGKISLNSEVVLILCGLNSDILLYVFTLFVESTINAIAFTSLSFCLYEFLVSEVIFFLQKIRLLSRRIKE